MRLAETPETGCATREEVECRRYDRRWFSGSRLGGSQNESYAVEHGTCRFVRAREARVSRLTELLRQARKADPQLGGDREAEIIAPTKCRRALAAADGPPPRSGGAPSNLCLMAG